MNEMIPGEQDVTGIVRDLEEIDVYRVVLIIASAWLLMKMISIVLPWLAARVPPRFRFYILPIVPIFRLIILLGAIILLVPEIIQPSFENLLAVVGALAFAIGFAFKDYASSLAAGMIALYEHPYRTGDWVRIDDAYGEVESVEARALRLRTLDDTLVTVPHKKIWDTNVYDRNTGRRELMCITRFYLNPRHDPEPVRQKLLEVALTSPYLQLDRPVDVIVKEKPWYTQYRLQAYPVEGRDQLLFITDLTVRGKSALSELGVEPPIAWPMPIGMEETDEDYSEGGE
jgi:small conductance mechanosensitive channel